MLLRGPEVFLRLKVVASDRLVCFSKNLSNYWVHSSLRRFRVSRTRFGFSTHMPSQKIIALGLALFSPVYILGENYREHSTGIGCSVSIFLGKARERAPVKVVAPRPGTEDG